MEKQYQKNLIVALILGLNLIIFAQLQAQSCYIRLSDASGITPTQYQLDSLESASCRLRDSLPVAFQDSFKVYDFGFYQHNENMVGGYPEMFQAAIAQVESQSQYYLLFGKQTDKTGVYTKFWLALKMPNSHIFSCITEGERNFLRLSIDISVNEKFEKLLKNPQFYSVAEIFGMEKLWQFFHKQKNCCYQNRGIGCLPPCPDSVQIKIFFENQGFLQRNVSVVFNPSKPDSLGARSLLARVNDFAQIAISENGNIRNLSVDAEYLLNGSISCFTNNNCKVFITKNSSLCDLELFHSIQNEFFQADYDWIGWIHVWQPTTSSEDAILFSKFKGKFYEDTESFIGEGNHCSDLPFEAYLYVPKKYSGKLNFQKVKENIENIYKDKNGYKLTVHLAEKNTLTFFDLYEAVVYGNVKTPGSSDWDGVTGITRKGANLYVDLKSFEINNGSKMIIDKRHGEYYIAYVTAHEYLHQISHKACKVLLRPWNPTFYDIENDNIFANGPHIGPESNYNLLFKGTDIPNPHNGDYLPKYYTNNINEFEKIDINLRQILFRSTLAYVLFHDTDPNNHIANLFVEQDKAWLKKLIFSFR